VEGRKKKDGEKMGRWEGGRERRWEGVLNLEVGMRPSTSSDEAKSEKERRWEDGKVRRWEKNKSGG
jgi:hypothetical protein